MTSDPVDDLISQIPVDIWLIILGFLEPIDIAQLGRVNTYFRQHFPWEKIFNSTFPQLLDYGPFMAHFGGNWGEFFRWAGGISTIYSILMSFFTAESPSWDPTSKSGNVLITRHGFTCQHASGYNRDSYVRANKPFTKGTHYVEYHMDSR